MRMLIHGITDNSAPKIPMQFMKFLCMNLKKSVWYAASARKITGPVCYQKEQ
jgi:hypothetical protein